MRTVCPHCQSHLEFDDAGLGQQVPCPSCGTTVQLENTEPPPPPTPTPEEIRAAKVQHLSDLRHKAAGLRMEVALAESRGERAFGMILIILGMFGLAYYWLGFEISTFDGQMGRITNHGLMNDRLVGCCLCVGMNVMGAAMHVGGWMRAVARLALGR